jgi:mannose/fructose/N-acetylgalactosamine-specific phosphotransferase system component IID
MAGMTAQMQMRLFSRSFLLQSCWSFERMQNLGFAYCVDPWLKHCYEREEDRRQARLRHQEFFNTQPYMAPLVLGMVCALEEEVAVANETERPAKLERLRTLKTAAASALAGLGDALFWGALRPFCAALALSGALLLANSETSSAALWAAVVYLLAYNVPVLTLRWRFLRQGYEWKDQIGVRFKDFGGQRIIRLLRWGGLALTGLAAVLMLAAVAPPSRLPGLLAAAVAVICRFAGLSGYRLYAGRPASVFAPLILGGYSERT